MLEMFLILFFASVYCLNRSIGIIFQFNHFHAAQPSPTTGRNTVVMEKIPFPLKFNNGMMRSPTNNRRQNNSLIDKWPVRIVTNGITQ
jgi:hypothetical protein